MGTITTLQLTNGALSAYAEWFETESRHGDTLVYFTGDLNAERLKELPSEDDKAKTAERVRLILVDAIADRVKVDAINGFLALTQRRLGDHSYQYRATRLRPERERLRQATEQSDAL